MYSDKPVFKHTADQLQELISWREERSAFWTQFSKQTQTLSLQLKRLANANAHAKQATELNAELNQWL